MMSGYDCFNKNVLTVDGRWTVNLPGCSETRTTSVRLVLNNVFQQRGCSLEFSSVHLKSLHMGQVSGERGEMSAETVARGRKSDVCMFISVSVASSAASISPPRCIHIHHVTVQKPIIARLDK